MTTWDRIDQAVYLTGIVALLYGLSRIPVLIREIPVMWRYRHWWSWRRWLKSWGITWRDTT